MEQLSTEHLRPPPIRIPKNDEDNDKIEDKSPFILKSKKKFLGRVVLKIILFTGELIYHGVVRIYHLIPKKTKV